MPCFRGIELSIVASYGTRKLPEYPHPDGSSVRLLNLASEDPSNESHGNNKPPASISSACSDAELSRHKKVNPRVSVYIPSTPGERFWLRYMVKKSPPPSRYVFFKIFMNGHHIVSWGVDTNNRTTGTVTRALYQPGERWLDRITGIDLKSVGIETRYFRFMLGLDQKSIADDGGLIEVRAFRCKGRKRVAPKLEEYHHQERYGIMSPTDGLVENPEDATYYDYLLLDPKDSPYATFCFHYRTMKYLEQLNLVPEHEPKPQPVLSHQRGAYQRGNKDLTGAGSFTFGVESLDTEVFGGDNRASLIHSQSSSSKGLVGIPYRLEISPKDPFQKGSKTLEPDLSKHPSAESNLDGLLKRPLPELPRPHSRQSSKSSLRSNCPSLTPSLMNYADSDDFDSSELKLATTQSLLVPSESAHTLELRKDGDSFNEENSVSDYAVSPASTRDTSSPGYPSPKGYIPTTGSALERQMDGPGSLAAQASPKKSGDTSSSSASTIVPESDAPQPPTLKLTESEWLKRMPSPSKRRSQRSERLWNPRNGKRPGSGSSSGESVVPVELCNETETSHTNPTEANDTRKQPHLSSENQQAPSGNWI